MEPDIYLVPTPRAMKKALGTLPGNSVSKKPIKSKKKRLVACGIHMCRHVVGVSSGLWCVLVHIIKLYISICKL